jgi:hypothetical protein
MGLSPCRYRLPWRRHDRFEGRMRNASCWPPWSGSALEMWNVCPQDQADHLNEALPLFC